jgi:ABC-type transporter Mla subunit MlaD
VRRIALILATLVAAGAAVATTSASGDDSRTYYIELDNAFGLVKGSEVKVAGVSAGQITDLFINSQKRAVVKVELSGPVAVLGEDTVCSSEPQSLIAEYFIDCTPKGPPIDTADESDEDHAEDPDIPVEQTRQTVQNDLVLSTMRMPFRERLTLLINSFGTALAGNSENLNSAIRRGAPALEQTQQVFHLLAQQNTIIRDLNADSDEIIGRLAERRRDVTRFIQETRDTAEASAARRDDLSQNFALLDDFLAQLKPTMAELNSVAVQGTPLAANLRRAAPGLTTLSRNLPNFNPAATDAVVSLGKSSVVGQRALRKGRDEVRALRDAARNSAPVAEDLANFLLDIDDPKRAVEVDARAARDTNRKAPTGYTGMEGLLNYLYYQTLAINQYDEIGHFLHFTIMEVGTGPCANYNAGPTIPSASGGDTTSIADAHRCVAWLGPNQPGINQSVDVPPYDPSVCPGGSNDLSLCNPAGTTSASDGFKRARAGKGGTDATTAGTAPGTDGSSTGADGTSPDSPTPGAPDDGSTTTPTVPTTPGAPTTPAPGGSNGGKNGSLGLGILGLRGNKSGQGGASANEDLLGYLFGS